MRHLSVLLSALLLVSCTKNIYYEVVYYAEMHNGKKVSATSYFGFHDQKIDSFQILCPFDLYLSPTYEWLENDTEVVERINPLTMEVIYRDTIISKMFEGKRYSRIEGSQMKSCRVALNTIGQESYIHTLSKCEYKYLSWNIKDTTLIPAPWDTSFCNPDLFVVYTGRDTSLQIGGEMRPVSIFNGASSKWGLRHFKTSEGISEPWSLEIIYVDRILKIPLMFVIYNHNDDLVSSTNYYTYQADHIQYYSKREYYREIDRRTIDRIPDSIPKLDSSLFNIHVLGAF